MAKVIGSFKVENNKTNLAELFDKMQIAVCGRDDGKESEGIMSDES